ncbi:MAG: hypothetical protein WCP28_17975 [Actinomycetes bacterium]
MSSSKVARLAGVGVTCLLVAGAVGAAPADASDGWRNPAPWANSTNEWVPTSLLNSVPTAGTQREVLQDRVREWNDSNPYSGIYIQVAVTRVSSTAQADRAWADNGATDRDYYGGPDPAWCPKVSKTATLATCSNTGGQGIPYTVDVPNPVSIVTGFITRASARHGLYIVRVREFSRALRSDILSPAQLGAYAAAVVANLPTGIPVTDLPADADPVVVPSGGGVGTAKTVASRLASSGSRIAKLSRSTHRAYRALALSRKRLASVGLPTRTITGLSVAGFGVRAAHIVFLRYSFRGTTRCARANARRVGASFVAASCPTTSWRPAA